VLTEEHLNTLECFEFDIPQLKIKSRFRSYEIDAQRLEPEEFEQIKDSLARQNWLLDVLSGITGESSGHKEGIGPGFRLHR